MEDVKSASIFSTESVFWNKLWWTDVARPRMSGSPLFLSTLKRMSTMITARETRCFANVELIGGIWYSDAQCAIIVWPWRMWARFWICIDTNFITNDFHPHSS